MDDEHLDVRQVAEFILDGLDDSEIEAVCRHFENKLASFPIASSLDSRREACSWPTRRLTMQKSRLESRFPKGRF